MSSTASAPAPAPTPTKRPCLRENPDMAARLKERLDALIATTNTLIVPEDAASITDRLGACSALLDRFVIPEQEPATTTSSESELHALFASPYEYRGKKLTELLWDPSKVEQPVWTVEPVEERDAQTGRLTFRVQYRLGDSATTARPGRNADHQPVALTPIDVTFTAEEWQTVALLLPQYLELERASHESDIDVRRETRQKLLRLMRSTPSERTQKIERNRNAKQALSGGAMSLESFLSGADARSRSVIDTTSLPLANRPLIERVREVGAQLLLLNRERVATVRPGVNGRRGGLSVKRNPASPETASRIPTIAPDFKETPYIREKMEDVSEAMLRELTDKKGIVNLIGDMGTGKNYIIEHLAALTHRPFYHFPCAKGLEVDELIGHTEFAPETGTRRVLTDLAKGLSTPGAIVLIDEPNALEMHVVAAFHSLGDHNQSLMYDGVRITKAPGVIVAFAMNPATYGHTKNLAEAILDRTLKTTVRMSYPPFTRADELVAKERLTQAEMDQRVVENPKLVTEFVCDEALMYAASFPALQGMTDRELSLVWEQVVNGTMPQEFVTDHTLAAKANEPGVRKALSQLADILRVASSWRHAYMAQDRTMSRTISYRGVSTIVDLVREYEDVSKAYIALLESIQNAYDTGPDDLFALRKILVDVLGPAKAPAPQTA